MIQACCQLAEMPAEPEDEDAAPPEVDGAAATSNTKARSAGERCLRKYHSEGRIPMGFLDFQGGFVTCMAAGLRDVVWYVGSQLHGRDLRRAPAEQDVVKFCFSFLRHVHVL